MNPKKIIDGKLDAKWDFDRLNFFRELNEIS